MEWAKVTPDVTLIWRLQRRQCDASSVTKLASPETLIWRRRRRQSVTTQVESNGTARQARQADIHEPRFTRKPPPSATIRCHCDITLFLDRLP